MITELIAFFIGVALTSVLIFLFLFHYKKKEHLLNKQILLAVNAGKVGIWGMELKTQIAYNINGDILEKDRTPLGELYPLFYSEEDFNKFSEAVEDVVSERVEIANVVIRYKSYKTGEFEYVDKEIAALRNSKGEIDRVIGTHRNITNEVTTRKRLEEAKNKAEQSDHFKTMFLVNMSHEVRTPLNAILGFSELLVETNNQKEREEYIDIIRMNNDLLLSLVDDVLDLAKIESGFMSLKLNDIDIVDLLEKVVLVTSLRAKKKNIKVSIKSSFSKLIIKLDAEKLHRVCYNFLVNAIKFTPEGGQIEVRYFLVDDRFRIEVKDNGIGIAQEDKKKVFSRFEKIDNFSQGSGLGLSLCKDIVEHLGGTIGFDSVVDEGSIFWAEAEVDVVQVEK